MSRQFWERLGDIWTLPNTLLGVVLGMLNLSFPHRHAGVLEIPLRRGVVLGVCRLLRINAFTVGQCVLYACSASPVLRLHEGRHVWQYRILGPLFLPLYFVLLAVYGYDDHPFERDARYYTRRSLLALSHPVSSELPA